MTWLPLITLVVGVCFPVSAQVRRIARPTVHPRSVLAGTLLSISAAPSAVSFALVSRGAATGNNPVVITSTLANPLNTSVDVFSYFASASSALTGNASGAVIPSSCILGQVPTGVPTVFTGFTQTGALGTPGATLHLVGLANLTTTHTETDYLYLKIDLSSLPNLPADTYSGVLYIIAQAM